MPLAHPRNRAFLSTVRKNEAVHPTRPGKYEKLLQAVYDFAELVAVHDSSMELVESAAPTGDHELPLSQKPYNKTFILL